MSIASQTQTRLLLADDHRMFRQGLRELIERKTNFEVVGEAQSGTEVLAQVERLRPDIVLLDIQMPELDGISTARRLADQYPDVKIIMLTMYRQDRHIMDSIRAGIKAYLLKDADAEELIDIVERVQRGESALDQTLTSQVFAAVRRQDEALVERFTEREREILRLVAAGHDNRTIASQLCLSEKTVGNRLSEIFQKLNATNRTQAARTASDWGVI